MIFDRFADKAGGCRQYHRARALILVAVDFITRPVAGTIRVAVNGACAPIETSFATKPHGRRAWSIYFTGGDAQKQCTTPIIDLSVMPRMEQPK